MPPKKKTEPIKNNSESSDSEIDIDVEIKKSSSQPVNKSIKSETTQKLKPMLVTSNASDNARVKLANAINNLTIKSDEFMSTMKNFDTFRESIVKLDIEMESKKVEYNDFILSLEQNQKNRMKELDNEYSDKQKDLTNKHNESIKSTTDKYLDMNKKLENEYSTKMNLLENDYKNKQNSLTNEFKNNQIKVSQDLMEYKLKACETLAKENGYVLIKQSDKDILEKNKAVIEQNYNDLKDKFDTECNKIKHSEENKYKTELKNAMSIFELKNKAENADMKAQVDQQKREIEVLHNTINNLKNELVEQRQLTKEVAQASAKSQITQKFGKDIN